MRRIIVVLLSIILTISAVPSFAEEWQCEKCSFFANGNFCSNCGNAKPTSINTRAVDIWTCMNCGESSSGNFCSNCGSKIVLDTSTNDQPSQSILYMDEESQYAQAVEYQNNKNYVKAIELYAMIPQYQDAELNLMKCVELLASEYYDNEEYVATQTLLLQFPSKKMEYLLAKCNDHCFLIDLQKALSERWTRSNKDTSLMSDAQLKEYFGFLVSDELKYIDKYSTLSFSDSILAEYANAYISALQKQRIAIDEYFDSDQDMFNDYWNQGYNSRQQMIYRINRKFGLDFPSEYWEMLKESVIYGQFVDMWFTTEGMLVNQLNDLEYELEKNKYGNYEFAPLSIMNTTDYQINYLSIKMNFHDAEGKVLDNSYLFSGNYINRGSDITFSNVYMDSDLEFDSVSFSYEFIVENDNYWSDIIEGTVIPHKQYSMENGILMKNGALAEGQPILEIVNLTSQWEVNQFVSKKLYVPVLRFSIKNAGNAPADNVTVRCTFIDKDTQEIWSEETVYLVSASDSALMPNYSKKAIVYSPIGFNVEIINVPDLIADIYINDTLFESVTISS